ncbi:MAG: adenylate/guanylate cyclase domain-containing protein [Paracoccaceae bacterium]
MTASSPAAANTRTGLFARFRRAIRDPDLSGNPHLRAALAEDLRIGQSIAATARSVTVVLLVLTLPLLIRDPGIIFPLVLMLGLIATDLLRRRFARRGLGRSGGRNAGRIELVLMTVDLVILLFLTVLPNPFIPDRIPSALTYMTGKFTVFYILLALSTLIYSWRAILTMGLMISATWLIGAGLIAVFGNQNFELAAALEPIFQTYPRLRVMIDPNSVHFTVRLQEVVAFMIVAVILTLKSWRSEQLILRQAELAGERANLSRYFSPNMVDVLASRDSGVGAVREAEIAVLFADIVGFTKLAEAVSPQATIDILRRYYGALEKAVFENGGTLDKYLGDGVMATFGTPEPGPDDAWGAVRAARQIITEMEAINATEVDPALRVGVSVGVHFGPATMGNVGPSRRLEFAVLGDTVNVASRLETATRALGCRIVVSDAAMARLGADAAVSGFVPHRGLELRGREGLIDVWTYGAAAKA